MAEVGTIGTPTVASYRAGGHLYTQHRMTCTSSSDTGAVSGIDKTIGAGRIVAVKAIPVTSGGTQPTNLFDVTLLDSDSLDLLGGNGANCANTGPTLLNYAAAPIPFPGGKVQPTVANAGNSKVLQVEITVEG